MSIREGIELADWTDTQLKIIKGADHTFGSEHPWFSNELPDDLQRAVEAAKDFFLSE